MSGNLDLDENFETTLEFLQAFVAERDDELEDIKDSVAKDDLLVGLLQVNLILLSRLSDHEEISPEEILEVLSSKETQTKPPKLRLL